MRAVDKFLSEASHRDQVEGRRYQRSRVGLPYRHAAQEVAVAARRLVAREADHFASLLARRAYEAEMVGFILRDDHKQHAPQ